MALLPGVIMFVNFLVTMTDFTFWFWDLAFWCLNKCFSSAFYRESLLYFVIENYTGIFIVTTSAVNTALLIQKGRLAWMKNAC